MKHIALVTPKSSWKFNQEPFPAYRWELVFGRNQRSAKFLTVLGTEPLQQGETCVLPDNKFVIRTTAKGTKVIEAGVDESKDVLLFVGCSGGFRGNVLIIKEFTTAEIILICEAGNAVDSRIEVAARLQPGQAVVFHSYGRRNNEVIVYSWDGKEITTKVYKKAEWDLKIDLESSPIVSHHPLFEDDVEPIFPVPPPFSRKTDDDKDDKDEDDFSLPRPFWVKQGNPSASPIFSRRPFQGDDEPEEIMVTIPEALLKELIAALGNTQIPLTMRAHKYISKK